MNLKQLELKRWTELLQAVRRARHITHAKRVPLARYLKLDKQALDSWNKAIGKLLLVNPAVADEYDRLESDARDHLSHLAEKAEEWASLEKDIVKRVAKVRASKVLTKPSAPIEERIAKRRKERARRIKSETATAAAKSKALRDAQGLAVQVSKKVNGVRISDAQLDAVNRLLRDPLTNGALLRAQVRGTGKDKAMVDVADEFQAIANMLRDAGYDADDFNSREKHLTGILVTLG